MKKMPHSFEVSVMRRRILMMEQELEDANDELELNYNLVRKLRKENSDYREALKMFSKGQSGELMRSYVSKVISRSKMLLKKYKC